MSEPSVLLVDDEKHIRLLMRQVLVGMNFKIVEEAANGEEAISLFSEHRPLLTLLDITMPLKTGIEALAEIKKIEPNALVIMLTSIDESDDIEECLRLGAANYIRKDTPLEQIKLLIKETWHKYSNQIG